MKRISFAGDTEPTSGLPPQATVGEDERTVWLTVTQDADGRWQAGYQETGGHFLKDFIGLGDSPNAALKELGQKVFVHLS